MKRFAIIIPLMAMLFPFCVAAQKWEKDFNYPSGISGPSTICFDYKPGVGTSSIIIPNTGTGFRLCSMNLNGDTLWTKPLKFDSISLSPPGYFRTAITSDKKHIVGGNLWNGSNIYQFFLTVDSLGNNIDFFKIPDLSGWWMLPDILSPENDPGHYFSTYKNDTTYISPFGNTIEEPRLFVQKRTINGSLVWSKTISCIDSTWLGSFLEPHATCVTDDGNLVVIYSVPCNGLSYMAEKINGSTGATVFQVNLWPSINQYSMYYNSTAIGLSDSTVAVVVHQTNADTSYFFKLNSTGSIMTSHVFPVSISSGFERTGKNKLLFTYYGAAYPGYSGILQTDLDGNLLNSKTFPWSQNKNYITYAHENNIGGLFTAFDYSLPGQTLNHWHMVNSDSLFNTNPGIISGAVTLDNNANCTNDAGDYGVNNALIQLTDANGNLFYGISVPGGTYSTSVPLGQYSVSQIPSGYKGVLCPSSAYNFQIATDTSIANVNFFDTLTANVNDLSVAMFADHFVPGFNTDLYVYCTNKGTVQSGAVVSVVRDPLFNFVSSVPAPSLTVGDTLFYQFPSFPSDSTKFITITFHTDSTVTLNTGYSFKAGVNNLQTDLVPADNNFTLNGVVMGAYDPNDKSVNQPQYINGAREMIYKIRFQNTGTLPAHDIMLLDTLSADLDLTTFKVLDASHNYNVQITQDRRMIVRFLNIMLPDSFSNEPASHGHFTYAINTAATFQPNDNIKNTAYIYFDYNAPVITNTTQNIYSTTVAVSGTEHSDNISVFPNPARWSVFIANKHGKINSVRLMNAAGQLVLNNRCEQSGHELKLPSLPAGIYLLLCETQDGTFTKKLVIE